MTKRKRWLLFLGGMLAGTILMTVIIGTLLYFGGSKVWLLKINTYDVTSRLKTAVSSMSEETLKQFIETLKPQIPELAEKTAGAQFGAIRFDLGGEHFALPEELATRLDENYRRNLVRTIEEFLNSLPLDQIVTDLGVKAGDLMENAIYAEYNSRLFEIGVGGVLALPVRLELMNQEGVKAFQLKMTAEPCPKR